MKQFYSGLVFFTPVWTLPRTRDAALFLFDMCSESSFVHLCFDNQTDWLLNILSMLSLLIFTQSYSS